MRVVLVRSVILSGLLGTLGLMSAGGAGAQGASPPAGAAFDGAYIYEVRCSNCHGKKGEGMSLFGIPLRGNAFITQGSVESIGEAIHNGRAGQMKRYPDYAGMPRFQGIRAGELSALIAYMKTDLQR